jgi:hypothetical protein
LGQSISRAATSQFCGHSRQELPERANLTRRQTPQTKDANAAQRKKRYSELIDPESGSTLAR